MSEGPDIDLELDASVAAAGGRLAGRVRGAQEVVLVRREHTPGARGGFHVAADVPDADGRFELAVPEDAPPSAASGRCRLEYAVIARRPERRRADAVAEEVTVGGGRVMAHLTPGPHDRLIASFDARRFHVELADADLRGGGELAGRVHAHRGEPPEHVLVCARLLECWRMQRSWNAAIQPLWRDDVVWESEPVELRWPRQRHWVPFAFRLPALLPPAVEGRLLAWRYEVEARRPVRFAFDQRAVLTPIGFQAA